MRLSQRGHDLIKRFEGFSANPYLCPASYWTIGYGHVITKADAEKFAAGISRDAAEALLKADVRKAEAAVGSLVKVRLSQGQFDALVSFTFNLGARALQSSTLRMRLNRGDYTGAREQFERWVYAGGRVLPGLVKRRQAEAELFGL